MKRPAAPEDCPQIVHPLFVATFSPGLLARVLPKLELEPVVLVKHNDCSCQPDALFRVVEQCMPSVLLVDIEITEVLGPWALRQFRARLPKTQLVLIYRHIAQLPIDEIIINDVVGCLSVELPKMHYKKAIHAVLAGDTWLPRSVMQQVLQALRKRFASNEARSLKADTPSRLPQSPLTLRELEVARLAREGLSNKEIARRLDISEDTVKAHLKRIFDKLGLQRRSQISLHESVLVKRI